MTREQIKQIVRLTESIVNKRLNESNDIEKWLNQDSDYGIIKSVNRNKRNNKQAKITSTDYPNGIYLEYDGWGNWVEIDKPLNFNESISKTPSRRLNENGSYYRTEFSKISAAPGPTQPKIQIMDEHAKTKWIDLNNDSVPELIGWLQRTF